MLATGESTMGPPPSVSPKVAEGTRDRRGNKSNEPDQTSTMRETAKDGSLKLNGTSINIENINIATYVCDFGNVIITKSAKKSFRLTNVGKIPITFNFDKKILN